MSRPLVWAQDGRDWPLREASRFVQSGGLRWHVQRLGRGPVLLLIHGTGASTHSWAALAQLLAQRFTLLSVDLPGHAFTPALPARQMSLPGMAHALGRLVDTLGLAVQGVLGHSAGAAIGAQMMLDGAITPRMLLGLNAALLPLSGLAGWLFPAAARLMAATALAPRLCAWRAGDARAVQALMAGTGSTLDPAGIQAYARLLQAPRHVAGVLAMMAHWDLAPLVPRLHTLAAPVALLAGVRDRAVPLAQARRVLPLLPGVPGLTVLPGVGHLAHEENPRAVATWVLQQTAGWAAQRVFVADHSACQTACVRLT